MVTLSAASFLQQQKLQTAVRFSIIQYGEIALFMNLKLQIKSCENTLVHLFHHFSTPPTPTLPPTFTNQSEFFSTPHIKNW